MVLRIVVPGEDEEELDEPPGRDLMVSAGHTLADLASAIDRAFARKRVAIGVWEFMFGSLQNATGIIALVVVVALAVFFGIRLVAPQW